MTNGLKTGGRRLLSLFTLIFYSHTWSGVAGQSCSQSQLNSTLSCYANVKAKLDGFLYSWPESNVLPNVTNALLADVCKSYADANTCANATAACKSDPQIANVTTIGDYLCAKQKTVFTNKSDCVQNLRSSGNQTAACNYLNAAVVAMKNQMTSVNLCDYYRDSATCAYTIVQGPCGNDTGTSLTGLLDIVAHQRIVNCSFIQCGDQNYCQWGQLCRSARSCACATVCPQLSEPVCANDGMIYANPCLVRADACNKSSWLIKRPQAYCDVRAANPKTCDDQRVDSMMSCAAPLYTSLVNTLSSTGAFFFAGTAQQLTDTCAVYTTFKTCVQNATSQCPYQNIKVLRQFYDYLCSSQGNSDLTSSSVATCRQALLNDATASKCVKTFNSTLTGLPYYGLKQYPFSLSDEMGSVCSGSSDAYGCAASRIQALCDQNANAVYSKLFNGSFEVFQESCNQSCKAAMGDTYGVISTNNWPYGRTAAISKCTWHIQVPSGLSVNLLVYPNRPFDCQSTKARFINVYSGDTDTSANLIGEYCPAGATAARVISTAQSMNRMTVVYSSTAIDGSRAPDVIAMYYAGLDACASNPCSSGTACVNQIGGYLCQSGSSGAGAFSDGFGLQKERDVTCKSGWTLYLSKCYLAVKNAVDEPTAESGCRDGRGHLVTILSATENDFVTQMAVTAGVRSIWTGLRWEDNTRWKWLSQDGATYFAWGNGQPLNANASRCVVLNAAANGLWETRQCYPTTADGYVCRSTPVDPCNPNPCQNGGTCQTTNGGAGASCTCAPGYTGFVCERQQQTDACASNPCSNGGTCSVSRNGTGTFQCACATGFTGPTCATGSSACASNPCLNGGTCVDGGNQRYTCQCPSGYTGATCATAGNACSPNPCLNGGTCASTSNGTYNCTCPAAYAGATCSALLDPCFSIPCKNGGTCTRGSSGGGYTCTCPTSYSGTNCEIVTNVCTSSTCMNGGNCSSSGSNFTCACVLGFTGSKCETNINECASNPCLNGGTCVDGVNEFSCKCAATWSGATCNQRISNCNPNPCKHLGTCVVLSETEYICKCADGFVGEQCENDNDECAYSPCTKGATCLNTFGSFKCICPNGVSSCGGTGGAGGGTGACASSPCRNGGTCIPNSSGFTCTCAQSYSGPTCDQAACGSGWSFNQGYCYMVVTTASSMNDGHKYCVQQSGELASVRSVEERDFIGKQMAAQKVDQAWIGARSASGGWSWSDGVAWTYTSWYTGEPKDSSSSSCVRMITGYGFSWDTKSCDSPVPYVCKKLASGGQNFCSSKPCMNGGACVNLADHYECSCASGYSGSTCQTQTGSGCTPACQNGGTCTGGVCSCTQGFTGSTCATPCPSGWSWSSSTCYFGVNSLTTYDQAVSSCPQKQAGSYLLTTLSQAEFDYAGILMNQMQSNVWLGLRYDTTKSQFVWITGSALNPSDFKAWGPNQPASPQTRNCGRITGSTGFIWETEECSHTLRYICKYKG